MTKESQPSHQSTTTTLTNSISLNLAATRGPSGTVVQRSSVIRSRSLRSCCRPTQLFTPDGRASIAVSSCLAVGCW
eukprot:XP_014040617.1 PREDICTED: uncharacterized protein LOC106593765 isoform X2 [Salmo salar]